MADASNDSVKSEVLETRKQLEELDKNYRNLKGLSQRGKGCIVLRGISRTTLIAEAFLLLQNILVGQKKIELFVSFSAVDEYEELQEKYQEYYQKASEVVCNNCLFLFRSYPADSYEMRTRSLTLKSKYTSNQFFSFQFKEQEIKYLKAKGDLEKLKEGMD